MESSIKNVEPTTTPHRIWVRGALERTSHPRARTFGVGVLILAAALSAPLWMGSLWLGAATTSAIYAVAVLSVVVLRRSTGTISLAQAAFMGMGAYGTAWCADTFQTTLVVSGLFGVAIAVLVGAAVSLPALRFQGMRLSILTLAVALAANALIFNAGAPLALNSNATATLPEPPTVLGISVEPGARMWWFQLVLACGLFGLVGLVLRSRIGVMWKVITTSVPLATASGVRITPHRLLGFCLSASLAATAGVMLLVSQQTVSADNFSVGVSLAFVVFAMLAGLDKPVAAVTAGVLIGAGDQILIAFGLQGQLVAVFLGLITAIAIVVRGRTATTTGISS